jgi:creatinine amidohydrolase
MRTYRMGEMTVAEMRKYLKKNQTIVLPYGVIEQHGYHLPLDTDVRNATFFGEILAQGLGCVLAPTINYSFSGGMLEGTINVRPNTFANYVCEIIESLVVQGFRNILVMPGHGGSETFVHLKESLRIAKWVNPSLKDACVMMLAPWEFSPTWMKLFSGQDFHAAQAETSLILHWTPEAVRGRATMDTPAIARMMRHDPDSYQVRAFLTGSKYEIPTTSQDRRIKVGVMGYPERASAAFGKKLCDEIRARVVPAVRKAIAEAERSRRTGKRATRRNVELKKLLQA